MTRILFVCTGNVYRSVLAERLLAVRLAPGAAVLPESAGTRARPRPGMDPAARAVLERLGGDGSGFTARRLTAPLVADAALVLGLAREHREAAVRLAPSAMRRCFTLKEFVRLATDGTDEARGRVPEEGAVRGASGLGPVVAAASARRGAVLPVPAAEDEVTDPWDRPHEVLDECAQDIDRAVRRLALLLDGGGVRG
ncbi:arsenate reductase/protein-tyrosine-phosphatase family protein [Streptomyces nodosus]